MGTYDGDAALVLDDHTKIEGRAAVRISVRSWEGVITVPADQPFRRASEAMRIELADGRSRPIVVTVPASFDTRTGAFVVSFASNGE